jgi:hypothetical protein
MMDFGAPAHAASDARLITRHNVRIRYLAKDHVVEMEIVYIERQARNHAFRELSSRASVT